jgi:hypothetical protein
MQPLSIVEDFNEMKDPRDAVVTELVLVRLGRVLPPLVGGMQQAGWPSSLKRHGEQR